MNVADSPVEYSVDSVLPFLDQKTHLSHDFVNELMWLHFFFLYPGDVHPAPLRTYVEYFQESGHQGMLSDKNRGAIEEIDTIIEQINREFFDKRTLTHEQFKIFRERVRIIIYWE